MMKLYSSFAVLSLFLFAFLIPTIISDLKSDRKALLDFASSVPRGRRLNWNTNSSVCKTWSGVICNPNGTRVVELRLPGIGLHGPVPQNTLGKLDALMALSLRSNLLNGNLPSDILSLPSLHYVYLQQNNFSGEILPSLSGQLSVIDFSFNSLTGNIPITIQNLSHLTSLNLQSNSLTGSIPDFNLPELKQLNLSNNQLNSSIPSSLQTYPSSSFLGNSNLCGKPLNKCTSISPSPSPSPSPPPSASPSAFSSAPQATFPLSPSSVVQPFPPMVPQKQKSKKKLNKGVTIALVVGASGVLFVLLLTVLVFCMKKKKTAGGSVPKGKSINGGRSEPPKEDFRSGVQDSKKNKLVFLESCSYNFNLEDLLRASAEVLGKGSFGTTYKAILEDGTLLAVKRLKEVFAGKREFEQHMKTIGRMNQHPSVVSLRAYYYSKDEKLLVYDYVTNGSLSTLLHGNRESGQTLDWESRLKISLGAARGVAHIHSSAGGRLTHGNIKSANVLLNQDLNACISDFGLAPLMGFPAVPSRGTGYREPEVIETKKSTHKSDVYSFGVLLLELLTGKAPVQSPGHDEAVDLPRWVQSVVREEWTAEVFDSELMKYQNIEEEMVQMLQLAMACVMKVPDMRPTMDEVVRMLDEIRQSDSENRASSEKSVSPINPTV